MHTAHQSFIEDELDFTSIRREVEVYSAELSLQYLDVYSRHKAKFNKKGKVDLVSARQMASVEASAMFLYTVGNAPLRTYDVVRSLWTRVYSGELDKQKLNGNVLLLGSGDTIPEVMALHVQVEVANVERYKQLAKIQLEAIQKNIEPLTELGKDILEAGVLQVNRPRLNQGKVIDGVEPDEYFAHIASTDLSANARFFPDTTFHKKTAGEFIGNTDQRYDLIVAMRTDPLIWSTQFEDYQFDEVVVPGFTGTTNLRTLRLIDREVGTGYDAVKRLVAPNGSLYISVGLGNDNKGFGSRVFLLENIARYGGKDSFFSRVIIDREVLQVDEWKAADPEVAVLIMTNQSEKKRHIPAKKKKRRRR